MNETGKLFHIVRFNNSPCKFNQKPWHGQMVQTQYQIHLLYKKVWYHTYLRLLEWINKIRLKKLTNITIQPDILLSVLSFITEVQDMLWAKTQLLLLLSDSRQTKSWFLRRVGLVLKGKHEQCLFSVLSARYLSLWNYWCG